MKELTQQLLEEYLTDILNLGQERKVTMHTGRQGAVSYQLSLNDSLGISTTREDVLKQFKRNGAYGITDFGIEYIGLFDPTWVEEWKGGACIKYAEITEQEFHKLKDESI